MRTPKIWDRASPGNLARVSNLWPARRPGEPWVTDGSSGRLLECTPHQDFSPLSLSVVLLAPRDPVLSLAPVFPVGPPVHLTSHRRELAVALLGASTALPWLRRRHTQRRHPRHRSIQKTLKPVQKRVSTRTICI